MADDTPDDYGFFAPPPPAAAAGPPPGARNDLPSALSAREHLLLAQGTRTAWRNMSGERPRRPGLVASIGIGFRLVPACWYVLRQRWALAGVALATAAVSGVVGIAYAFATGGLRDSSAHSPASLVLAVPLALALSALGVVGQAVVVAAATDTFDGRPDPLSVAWSRVLGKLPRLLAFAVVFTLERAFTNLVRSWLGRWVGGTVAGLIDTAWDFATYLTVPVLLYEDLDVLPSVRRSAGLVTSRFGTQVAARAAMSLVLFLLVLPVVLVAVVVATYSLVAGAILGIVGIAAFVGVAGAMNGILAAALYRYTVTGETAPGFTPGVLAAPFSS